MPNLTALAEIIAFTEQAMRFVLSRRRKMGKNRNFPRSAGRRILCKKNSPQEDITTMENVSTRMYVCMRMCLCVRENAVTFFLKYSKYDESDTRSCSNKKLLSIMENLHFADSTDVIIFVPIEYVSN